MTQLDAYISHMTTAGYTPEIWNAIVLHSLESLTIFMGSPLVSKDAVLLKGGFSVAFSTRGDCMLGTGWLGVVSCVSIEEKYVVSAILFPYISQVRVFPKDGKDFIELSYILSNTNVGKWLSHGWQLDEFGEYEAYDNCTPG